MKQYALYKGDKYLCGGTIYELAKFLVVQPKTIYFYTTPSYKKRCKDYSNRYIVIEVNDD